MYVSSNVIPIEFEVNVKGRPRCSTISPYDLKCAYVCVSSVLRSLIHSLWCLYAVYEVWMIWRPNIEDIRDVQKLVFGCAFVLCISLHVS